MSNSIPVLIVGGGPVGLALAGDLGWRGVPCLLIEQSDGSIYQPRQDFVGIRTMEFCRRWGLVSAVETSPYPRDVPQDNVYVTSLTGYELGRERFPSMGDEKPPPVSPQKRERCPQNMFDPILRTFASSHPSVELRYRTRLLGFVQDDDRVIASVEDLDGARRYEIEAQFVAGCDGARSLVRETLGIGMTGNPALTYTTNIIFRCPHLPSLHDKGLAYRFIILGSEGVWATIVAINGRDQWRMSIIGSAEPRELTQDEIHAAIRRAVGIDFDYEILTVLPWVRRELVADHFRNGRGFILGDAAHAMSPTGGFGMNTGLGDAVDLSWKLGAVLAGWGGTMLLESYETERRPVGARNVAEASRNLRRMLAPRHNPALLDDSQEGAETRARVGREFADAMRHEWFTLGMHLGYRYEGSPICWPDGTAAPRDDPKTYVPSARPGSRAPHAWLEHFPEKWEPVFRKKMRPSVKPPDGRSTLDLFGRDFILLDLGADASDAAALHAAARERRMPMQVARIDEPRVLALYERRLVLVRPDGHVAWRDDRAPAEPARLIDCVRGAVPAGVVDRRAMHVSV